MVAEFVILLAFLPQVGSGSNNAGMAFITSSTFSGNSAFDGGGIYNSGSLTIHDSTLSGNSATGDGFPEDVGGAIDNAGTLTLNNSTVSGNTVSISDSVGGIYNHGTLTLHDTIIAGNTAASVPDIGGARVNSRGHNLIGIGDGGSGYADTDLVGTAAHPIDPKLGPLQDNGGPTPTMALLPGSPAIDTGALTDSEWDQRGPGYPRLVSGATDIGAYEVQQPGTGPVARPRVFLVPETTRSQPSAPVLALSGASALSVPVSPVVASVDRFFASLNVGERTLVLARFEHKGLVNDPFGGGI